MFIFKPNNKYKLNLLVIASFTFVILSQISFSTPSGIANRLTAPTLGCGIGTTCHHAANNSAAVLLAMTGPTTVVTSSANSYTFTIRNASLPRSGCNIGVKTDQFGNTNIGTLAPQTGSGLKLLSNELVQSSPKVMTAGEAAYAFRWTAPSTPGVYYLRAIGMGCGDPASDDTTDVWDLISPIAITVTAPTVIITSPNGGEAWCQSSSHTVTWSSFGISNVRIDLSTNDGSSFTQVLVTSTPAAAGYWSWNISPTQAYGNNMRIRIRDVLVLTRGDTSDAPFTINQSTTITNQPITTEVCEKFPAKLVVGVLGANLGFRWRQNSQFITGATSATYSIDSTKLSDAGVYDVVITSACAPAMTSGTASLRVLAAPLINVQPVGMEICEGTRATFFLSASGSSLTYEWFHATQAIPNSNSPTFTINKTTIDDAGPYSCSIKGICPPGVISKNANLIIDTKPLITQNPVNKIVNEGSSTTFTAAADGKANIFTWRKNNTIISSGSSGFLPIQNARMSDSGTYDCVISNPCGTVTTLKAKLTVNSTAIKPYLTIDTISFGSVFAGGRKDTVMSALLKNIGTQAITITKTTLDGNDKSEFDYFPKAPITLNPGTNASMTFSSKPFAFGLKSAKLTFETNVGMSAMLNLVSFSVGVNLSSQLDSLDFGYKIQPATMSFYLYNTGNMDAQINEITIEPPPDNDQFQIEEPATFPSLISQNDSLKVTVKYLASKPISLLIKELTIKSANVAKPVIVYLKASSVSDVDESSALLINLKIIPNPSGDEVRFEFPAQNQIKEIRIIDILGNVVKRYSNVDLLMNTNLLWNLSDDSGNKCQSGVYRIVISSRSRTVSEQLIILR
ncbi:MAG: C-terminal target protein [Ignavibacteria bacterium]|nr:C-terminal target protein [Ignavibacteria bacterium]